jgi:hypothetical protein
MFAIVLNNVIMQMIYGGEPFTYDGNQYPGNWCYLSTPEEKAAIGMVDVIVLEEPNPVYYWVTQQNPVYVPEKNIVEIGYTAEPKDLDTVKATAVDTVNSTAYSILFPSDWMVVKSYETSTPIAPNWNTWRESIRLTANSTRDAIAACVNVDEVQNVMMNISWPPSPNPSPILGVA